MVSLMYLPVLQEIPNFCVQEKKAEFASISDYWPKQASRNLIISMLKIISVGAI